MFKTSHVRIEISGELKVRFMNLCSYHDITMWDIIPVGDKVQATIHATDLFRMKKLLRKTKIHIKIVKKEGIYFSLKAMKYQRIFYLFLLCGFFALWISSHFLWNIEIVGNENVSSSLMERFLKNQRIYYGMPLDKIPTEELEKEIRREFFEVTWVSASIEGTTLQIHMKENDGAKVAEEDFVMKRDIIASANGIVDSILVREGTALVKKGDSVKKGDILIEGKVEIPQEDGTIKRTEYVEAKGDVWIEYQYPVQEKLLLEYETKVYSGEENQEYEFRIHNMILGSSGTKKHFLRYDLYEEEITPLFMRKLFPTLKIYKKIYRDYLVHREKYSTDTAKEIITDNFNKIIKKLEEKGVQIIEKDVKISTNSVSVSLNGTLTVKELCKEKKE